MRTAKQRTDSPEDPRVKKLPPDLLRYYNLLREHIRKTPAGHALVRAPAQTLKVREGMTFPDAYKILEDLRGRGVIKGEHPWEALEVVPESRPSKPALEPDTKPSIKSSGPRPLVLRDIQGQARSQLPADRMLTPVARPSTKTSVVPAVASPPPKLTPPKPRVIRKRQSAPKKAPSERVRNFASELSDLLSQIDRIRVGEFSALEILDWIATEKRASIRDLIAMMKKHKRQK